PLKPQGAPGHGLEPLTPRAPRPSSTSPASRPHGRLVAFPGGADRPGSSGVRLVLAEDLAHRAAHLAERAALPQRPADRQEQVLVATACRLQLLEPAIGR